MFAVTFTKTTQGGGSGGDSEVDGVSDGMHDDDGGGDSEVDGVSGGIHDDDGGGDSEDEGIEEDGGEIDLVPAGGLRLSLDLHVLIRQRRHRPGTSA